MNLLKRLASVHGSAAILSVVVVVLAGFWTGPLTAADQVIRLPITADDDICCDAKELEFNQGARSTLKLKGIENLMLLNFDAAPLKGMVILEATLHLHGTDAKLMVRHVGCSTVTCSWQEGTGMDSKAADGEPCYLTPALGSQKKWAGPNSTFLDCCFGRGGSRWGQTYVTPDDEQWYAIKIEPKILEACAAGFSYGICVTDDNGQTARGSTEVVKDGNQGNNWFHAREQKNFAPYLTVTVKPLVYAAAAPVPALALVVKPWQHGADTATGGVEITWPGPQFAQPAGEELGYSIEIAIDGGEWTALPLWQVPAPGLAGEPVRVLLSGLKSGAAIKAKLTVVNSGGVISANGSGEGVVSKAFPVPTALALTASERAAGPPPVAEGSTVWAIPDCAKANPFTGNLLEESGIDYLGDMAGKSREANGVWSGADRTVHLHALRGEWVAFQVVCQNKDATPVTYAIKPADLKGPGGAVIPAAAVAMSTLWYQHIGESPRGWYADPMLPLAAGESFAVPNLKNVIEGQLNQTVYVELFVPKDAAPGAYDGALGVTAGKTPLVLPVHLEVGAALIPNDTHFTLSMNAYANPGNLYGAPLSDANIAAEQAFYKMCHLHRTDLAVVQYSHTGNHEPGAAPPIEGAGEAAHVKDWSDFDKRFGPLLTGSLFNGTPREGTAISHFILDLCEHYPLPMTTYKWNDVKWEEHWKVCGSIAQEFPDEYQKTFVAVTRDFIRHAKEQHYVATLQVLLNDKYFYKQYDAKRKKWGKGVCFWLFDEPQNIDDFTGLAFFGDLVRKAQAGDRKTLQYRVDVSRPQWSRTCLERCTDLNVSGGFKEYGHLLEDSRERNGLAVWTYAGSPTADKSALAIEAQALDLYSRGVDGYVPAESTGGPECWTAATWACLIYTGKDRGVNGPCASLRLKAYRRGEQDVEYVYLLAVQRGLLKDDPNRRQVAKLLEGMVQGNRILGKLDAHGAVTETITGLTPETFERLRIAIANELK